MEQLRQGFKRTELGVIPVEWIIVSIKQIASNIIDYRGVTPKKLGMDWGGGNIVALSAGNVKKGYIDFNSECYFGSLDLYKKWMRNGEVKKDDIVFTLEAPLGNVALIPDDNKYILSQRTVLIQLNRQLYFPQLFFQVLISNRFQNYISSSATGSTAKGIKRLTFEKLLLAIPPTLTEQKAIADALTDVDELITNLEKLIAKKKAIKQGAMQQLLTPPHKGGKRLEGFSGDWVEKRLGEVGDCIIGLTYSPNNIVNDGTLVLRSSNIQNNKLEFSDNVYVNSKIPDNLIVKKDDILICVRNGSRQLIGKCAILDERVVGHSFGAFMSVFRSPYSKFIFQVFQSNDIKRQIDENLGATINQITNKMLNSFTIPFPSELEQNAICDILLTLDFEISDLETKKKKFDTVKQGMMQELLTGKTRLV